MVFDRRGREVQIAAKIFLIADGVKEFRIYLLIFLFPYRNIDSQKRLNKILYFFKYPDVCASFLKQGILIIFH